MSCHVSLKYFYCYSTVVITDLKTEEWCLLLVLITTVFIDFLADSNSNFPTTLRQIFSQISTSRIRTFECEKQYTNTSRGMVTRQLLVQRWLNSKAWHRKLSPKCSYPPLNEKRFKATFAVLHRMPQLSDAYSAVIAALPFVPARFFPLIKNEKG